MNLYCDDRDSWREVWISFNNFSIVSSLNSSISSERSFLSLIISLIPFRLALSICRIPFSLSFRILLVSFLLSCSSSWKWLGRERLYLFWAAPWTVLVVRGLVNDTEQIITNNKHFNIVILGCSESPTDWSESRIAILKYVAMDYSRGS